MLTTYKPIYIEKILTNEKGEQFVVIFQIELVGGKLAAKCISATKIDSRFPAAPASDVLYLPGLSEKNCGEFLYKPSFKKIVSPFNEFFFFTSQPTRAPSF